MLFEKVLEKEPFIKEVLKMKIKVDKIHQIIQEYLITVIIPKIPDTKFKFGLNFLLGYMSVNYTNEMIAKYENILKSFGVIENDEIDIDKFKENAIKALKSIKTDNDELKVFNYIVDEDDILELYNIASRYADNSLKYK